MDEGTILIEVDATAVADLRALMAKFNIKRVDEMIATAVGVMNELKDFVRDGVVTVIDPQAPPDDPLEREVDLVFESLRRGSPIPEIVTAGR